MTARGKIQHPLKPAHLPPRAPARSPAPAPAQGVAGVRSRLTAWQLFPGRRGTRRHAFGGEPSDPATRGLPRGSAVSTSRRPGGLDRRRPHLCARDRARDGVISDATTLVAPQSQSRSPRRSRPVPASPPNGCSRACPISCAPIPACASAFNDFRRRTGLAGQPVLYRDHLRIAARESGRTQRHVEPPLDRATAPAVQPPGLAAALRSSCAEGSGARDPHPLGQCPGLA